MGKYEDLINVLLHVDRSLAYRQGPMSRGNYVDEWLQYDMMPIAKLHLIEYV